jgi:hypothetical protein
MENTQKQVNPSQGEQVTNKANKASKASKASKAKKASNERTAYQSQVLDINKAFKEERATLGHCLSFICQFLPNLPINETDKARVLKAAKLAKKDLKPYLSYFKPNAKSGKFSAFYALQGLYRMNGINSK